MSTRGHRVRRDRALTMNVRRRTFAALSVLVVLLVAAMVKLVFIQVVNASALSARGDQLRTATEFLPATRGAILDRSGNKLAYTIQGRAIAVRPQLFTDDTPLTAKDKPLTATKKLRVVLTAAQKRAKVADILVAALGTAQVGTKPSLLAKMTPLKREKQYVYVARNVLPAEADAVMDQISDLWDADDVSGDERNAVTTERQDIRQYPNGDLAAAVVGTTGWGGVGLSGVESKFESLLSGKAGSRVVQVDSQGRAIPGTATDEIANIDGADIRLTLDSDLQYQAQMLLATQVNASQAQGGCMVIKGVTDGQIYSLACYQPGKTALEVGDPAVTTSFEPGSVNKVVTFAAALERKLITPTQKFVVDGSFSYGGRQIHDAWVHSAQGMTAAGILGKSSNVGTLMIANLVGDQAFSDELAKFGLGRKTGIQLPGEDSGSYPPLAQWSGTTFANLPIGQGVRMTLIQLVDMYQAIGNGGVMLSPTVIEGTSRNGAYSGSLAPAQTRVMSPGTASTLLSMLHAPIQCGNQIYKGTGCAAAINGYEVAGKTGTAQKVDPVTKTYSATQTTATFAGVVPADHPKYAIAIMIDDPAGGSEGGTSAAPLFAKIASYALQEADVAPSGPAPSPYELYFDAQG